MIKLLVLALTFLTALVQGAEFYVSPTGLATNNGSINSPWNLQTALNHPTTVHAGDNINLRAGTYTTATVDIYYISRLVGASGQFITVRPYGTERAIIDGGVQIISPWVIFRDLEIFSSDPRRVSTQPGTWPTDVNQFTGIGVYSANVKLINNVLHDNAGGISGWADATDNEYYGNVIYYHGWQEGTYNAHGHGLYVQNLTGYKKIRDNIVFNQFDHGLHIYGSNGPINNVEMDGNIAFGNGALGLFYSRNVLIQSGLVAQNPIVTNNYTYFPPTSTLGGENRICSGMGCTNLQMTGNYWVSNGYTLAYGSGTIGSLNSNTFYGQTQNFPAAYLASNTIHPLNSPPTGTRIYVRPNIYELGRANVVIFNWGLLASVTVDFSSVGLITGDNYEIRDAQNFLGTPVVTGTYQGVPIAIPMTSTAVALGVGNIPYPAQHTGRDFQVFVIRKTGVIVPPPPPLPDTTAPVVNITAPTQGQTISGTVNMTATASDNVGVLGVQYKIDGVNFGAEQTTTPYTLPLITTTLTNGAHTIAATARDAAANIGVSPTINVTVNNVVPPPPGTVKVYYQAELGVLVAPMYAIDSALASGGKYVRSNTTNLGKTTITINVPTAGTYIFWGRILSANSNFDSFHVSVDGGPEDIYDTAQNLWVNAWQWTRVTGRIANGGFPSPGNVNPRLFVLTAGAHTITFRGADTYTYLDRILLTNDLTFVPTGLGL